MRNILKYSSLFLIVFIFMIFILSNGIIEIPFSETNKIVWNLLLQNEVNSIQGDVIHYLRLPRVVASLFIGSGLSLVGCVMQSILRNPLADPYLLGMSSGAGLGAIIAIILGVNNIFGFNCIGILAFLGAMSTTFLIILFAYCFKSFSTTNIVLLGISLNLICSAIISLLINLYANIENIQNITFWLMGSFNNLSWQGIYFLGIVIMISSIYFIKNTRILNLLLLGDTTAKTLGYNVAKIKIWFIILCSFITGLVVYNSGIIAFIGLIIPHIARLCVGNNYNKLLPMSIFLGAIFMLIADFFSRGIIIGADIPIGIIVSVIGGPLFIYLLINRNYRYGKI